LITNQCGFAPVCNITKTIKVTKTNAIIIQYISDCLAKEVRKGRGFIPVAVTPLKPLQLPAGSWRGYIKHSVWVLWTNSYKKSKATKSKRTSYNISYKVIIIIK